MKEDSKISVKTNTGTIIERINLVTRTRKVPIFRDIKIGRLKMEDLPIRKQQQ